MELAYRRLKGFIKNIALYKPKLSTEVFYSHDLSTIPRLQSNVAWKISQLKKEEIERLRDVWSLDSERVKKRLESGNSCCYVSVLTGRIVSYHWVQFKGIHFIQQANKHIEIKADELWIYHVRVAQNAQGKGVSTSVYKKILCDFKYRGFKKAHIYTSQDNIINRKSLEKLGFVLFHKVKVLKIKSRFFPISKIPF